MSKIIRCKEQKDNECIDCPFMQAGQCIQEETEEQAEPREVMQYKQCGFEDKPCGRKCIYYNTCTRNPYRYDQRGGQT